MAEISVEQLISIRQFAIDTASDVAKITGKPEGLLADAANIEAYILNGRAIAPVAPPAEAGVGEVEPPKPPVRSRARKK